MKYHRLYSNSAQTGLFTDKTIFSASIAQVSGQYVGWGDDVFDFDNDGSKSFLLLMVVCIRWFRKKIRCSGTTVMVPFNGSANAGPYFQTKKVGRGRVLCRLRQRWIDGCVCGGVGGKGILLHAKPPAGVAPNHWLTLKLQGTRSNRDGFGARIVASAGDLQQSVV